MLLFYTNNIIITEVFMHKKLTQVGGSWALLLAKPLIELLKINPVIDEVEITVIEDEIRIKKYKQQQ